MPRIMAKNITVCIPTYEMGGKGAEYLERNLRSLAEQTYKDFDVVVSDNSEDNAVAFVVDRFRGEFDIHYIRNPKRGAASNYNRALFHANGKYVRFLAQDDFLLGENALCAPSHVWEIQGGNDNPNPVFTGDIHHGNNKLGGPSALTVEREKALFFDESLTWLFDCDLYRRLANAYGEPLIHNGIYYHVGKGDHQLTNVLSDDIKRSEELTLRQRYD